MQSRVNYIVEKIP